MGCPKEGESLLGGVAGDRTMKRVKASDSIGATYEDFFDPIDQRNICIEHRAIGACDRPIDVALVSGVANPGRWAQGC